VLKEAMARAKNDPYWDFIEKYESSGGKSKAKLRIQNLETQIARAMAAAERASIRYDDSGPMEMASEKIEPLEIEVEILKWFLKSPSNKPPKTIMNRFENVQKEKVEQNQYQKEKRNKFKSYPNLVGKRIFWKSQKTKILESGIVLKQFASKWDGKPRYKAKMDNGKIWNIPHEHVKKIVMPKDHEKIVKNIEKEKLKIKDKKESFSIGQFIEWNSKKCRNPRGKIISIGRTKLKVQTVDQSKGQWWNIPISLITKVDGKKI
jgi:hypothetical protein